MAGDDATRGNALAGARQRQRMTQAHLARAAGVSERTVRRAERGAPLSDEVARSLCAVLGTDLSEVPRTCGGTPAAPASRRPMSPAELGYRLFSRGTFRWVGGVHPFLMGLPILLTLAGGGPVQALVVLACILCGVWAMYDAARRAGCTRVQAVEFLQGKRFVDGEPVEMDARVDALRALHAGA